ncbi:cation:proton antiporter [Oharaeibacter diazotrophicus]|uniref:Kef-type potassium/proton antiporter (CPA2 family) n=1 Tax=Oharaeibacter diazotrophicus TaxID=1920512 RepID=A0A4R6RBT0_9HYPH|nr:cation:proton antiporter [Oharaeibacter diazotrophicus]TDP83603.1 Kef-type potassium/proton antiporter (CPA2 family) [Oharaeibacter diazotrophicus]BBE72436.1 inner membrane protein YbaL [Pleomorphomonas sp. SM30]GLS79206.1 sodium:proton antiporter [Oharaeibacter diazotrophicus]
MPHETPLISTIVAGLVLAFVLGAVANRFRLPPLVGYLVAGVLVGPHTPGFVADQSLAPELAEIGVILLMFGVGLHFSLKDLMSVRFVAVPGALVQIGFATLLGWALGWTLGWSTGGSLVFGLALSVASTVVLLKALQERRLMETERGRIAIGWLIVEDLAMVLALVLIPAAASATGGGHGGGDPLAATIGRLTGVDLGLGGIVAVTLVKVAAFVGLMLVVGRRVIPWVLHHIAHSGNRELFRLGVLAIALGVAFGAAELFGVSLALGAFFAGMILSESELSHRAAQESLPLRDAFAVLFFVSVGMLFDPGILLESPGPLIATVAIIVVGKSIAAFLIVVAFRRTAGTALTISASLAQIGEFSFILAELGVGLDLLPEEGRNLILAGAIVSIILNPLVFFLADRIRPALEARVIRATAPASAAAVAAAEPPKPGSDSAVAVPPGPEGPESAGAVHRPAASDDDETPNPTDLTGHTVLVGYGRVGRLVGAELARTAAPLLVIEDADQRVEALQAAGFEVVVGNAAADDVLALANLPAARNLVVAIPDAFEAGQIVEKARRLNPGLLIVGRAHSDAEIDHLAALGADTVVMGERELARGMLDRLRAEAHPPAPAGAPEAA